MGPSTQPTRVFLDLMSQPCRAVWLLLKLNNLSGVEVVQLRITKGENRTAASLGLNPSGKLPFLQDGEDLRLIESGAILSYLAAKFSGQVAEQWFPTVCLKTRARVESLLHWHTSNTRTGSGGLFMQLVRGPFVTGKPIDPVLAAQAERTLQVALTALETIWLSPAAGGSGGPLLDGAAGGAGMYLGGLTQPSVADLQIACELEQLSMLNKQRHGWDMEAIMAPHAAVRAWMSRVASATAPHWEAAHRVIRLAAAPPRPRPAGGQQASKL